MKIELEIKNPICLVLLASLVSVANGKAKEHALRTANISHELGTSQFPEIWKGDRLDDWQSIYNQLCARTRELVRDVEVENNPTFKRLRWKTDF
jgi:hypothetical protein